MLFVALAVQCDAIEAPDGVKLPTLGPVAFKLEKRQHLHIANGQRAAHAALTAGVHAHEPAPDMRNCLWKLCRVDALLRHPPGHALDDLERFAQCFSILAALAQSELMPGKLGQVGYCAFVKSATSADASRIWSANGG